MTTDQRDNAFRQWSVEVNGIIAHRIMATTAAKARMVAVRAYWEAGYGKRGKWPASVVARPEASDD